MTSSEGRLGGQDLAEADPSASRPVDARRDAALEAEGVAGAAEDSAVSFNAEGVIWKVSEAGSGRSGRGADRGARLLLLVFSSAESDRPSREALVAASSLEELDAEGIGAAFARAKPSRTPPRGPSGVEPSIDDVPVS